MLTNIASNNFWVQVKTVGPLAMAVASPAPALVTAVAPPDLMLALLRRMQTLLVSLLP